MARTDFQRSIDSAARRHKQAGIELDRVRRLAAQNDMAGAFGCAFAFEAEVEKLALLARSLPAYTGHPKAAQLVEQVLEETIPVEMGYSPAGWFCLRIPSLLPKKGSGSPVYIQDYLYPAMRRFFQDKQPTLYPQSVLVFRHIYEASRPERAYRDHDNIELNRVADILALYLLPDDAPLRCAHYYCSAVGDTDGTEVYVVPRGLFPVWLAAENRGELEEDLLYETCQKAPEKHT